jgi:hypothetical protein
VTHFFTGILKESSPIWRNESSVARLSRRMKFSKAALQMVRLHITDSYNHEPTLCCSLLAGPLDRRYGPFVQLSTFLSTVNPVPPSPAQYTLRKCRRTGSTRSRSQESVDRNVVSSVKRRSTASLFFERHWQRHSLPGWMPTMSNSMTPWQC